MTKLKVKFSEIPDWLDLKAMEKEVDYDDIPDVKEWAKEWKESQKASIKNRKYMKPTEKELENLEKTVGGKIPADFKKFILSYGGSSIMADVVFKKNGRKQNYTFNRIYGKKACGSTAIRWMYEVGKNYYPPNSIPFGGDIFGNSFLIDLGAKNRGTIYYWDHEETGYVAEYIDSGIKVPKWAWEKSAKNIAASFTDFLNMIEIA